MVFISCWFSSKSLKYRCECKQSVSKECRCRMWQHMFLADSAKATLSTEIITFEINTFCWYIFIWYKFGVFHLTSMENCLWKEFHIDALDIIQNVYKALLPKKGLMMWFTRVGKHEMNMVS